MSTTPLTAWRSHLIESTNEMRALLKQTRRIAILGIKPEARGDQPAHFVAAYVKEAGFEIVPVPVLSAMVAPEGFVNTTGTNSSGSSVLSARTVTGTVFSSSPGAKVTVPDADW